MNKTLEDIIDAFHRKQIRHVLVINYPKIIKNKDINKIEGTIAWSKVIRHRRLNFVGHIFRLDVETPVRKAINECFVGYKSKRGRPKTTWLKTIFNDFKNITESNKLDIQFIEKLAEISADRKTFNGIVKRLMGQLSLEGT